MSEHKFQPLSLELTEEDHEIIPEHNHTNLINVKTNIDNSKIHDEIFDYVQEELKSRTKDIELVHVYERRAFTKYNKKYVKKRAIEFRSDDAKEIIDILYNIGHWELLQSMLRIKRIFLCISSKLTEYNRTIYTIDFHWNEPINLYVLVQRKIAFYRAWHEQATLLYRLYSYLIIFAVISVICVYSAVIILAVANANHEKNPTVTLPDTCPALLKEAQHVCTNSTSTNNSTTFYF